jgi:hypothetical protein
VRREIELAFEYGCIVVPVHFFVARTTDERVKPSWIESRPAGVAVQQYRKACRMWERIYANQGQSLSRCFMTTMAGVWTERRCVPSAR